MRCFMAQGGEFSEIINKTDAGSLTGAHTLVCTELAGELALLLRSCTGNKIVITTGASNTPCILIYTRALE